MFVPCRGVLYAAMFMATCVCASIAKAEDQPESPPGEEELKILPLDKDVPGDPPESGIRYWSEPFEKLPLGGCYVSVITRRDDAGNILYELWQNAMDGDASQIVFRSGKSLTVLGEIKPVCDNLLINDVLDPKDGEKKRLAPKRCITRTTMTYDDTEGYVMAACVCPEYAPGTVSLLPALFVSKSGKPGSFKYLGKLKGEPAEEADKKMIWSDGGPLLRLDNGRWRYYLNGFGPALAAVESDKLEGPWKFIRGNAGVIRELLPDGPTKKAIFASIVRVSQNNWHLWVTDKWPPQSIWHFWSADGLDWVRYGSQPEITRKAFGNHGIKCLRAFLDPQSGRIVGLLSVQATDSQGIRGWMLHRSSMPSDPPDHIRSNNRKSSLE